MPLKKNDCKNLFPLTFSGSLYILSAGLLLFVGLYRGELAAALAGSLLLAYALVSLLLCLFTILLWKPARLRLVQGKNGAFTLTIQNVPNIFVTLLCGAQLCIRYKRTNFYGKQAYIENIFPISGPETHHDPHFPGYGVFIPAQEVLILHDFASFYRFPLHAPARSCCEPVFKPVIPEQHAGQGSPSGTTTQTTGLSSYDRSENLYETRTYLPGDDPRKINWKVFAHSGSLSIREGELLPPPNAEYFCIFNSKTPRDPDPQTQLSFCLLVKRAASYLSELCSKNRTITLIVRGTSGVVESVSINNAESSYRTRLFNTLALLALSPEAPSAEECLSLVPAKGAVLFFTLPEPLTEILPWSRTNYLLGPYPDASRPHSLHDTLRSVICIPRTLDASRSLYQPSVFHALLERFSAEGLSAHII